MKNSILLTAVLIAIASCNQQSVDTKAEEEKLMQTSRDWSKAAAGNNIDSIVNYWAEDAVFFDQHQGKLVGKAAIKQMVESSKNIPGFSISWEPEFASVSASGDMGYLIERNQITVPDSSGKPMVMRGSVVTIWKKDAAGNWKNVVDIGMDDAPKQ